VSVLSSIYTQAKERLETISYYTDTPAVTLITQDMGDIANQIQIALGRLGVCAVFLMRSAYVRHPDIPGPYLEDIDIVVQVAENVTINRGRSGYKDALSVAEHIASTDYGLHLWKPASINEVIVCDELAIELLDTPPPGATLAYNVNLTTKGGLTIAP